MKIISKLKLKLAIGFDIETYFAVKICQMNLLVL
jgi:hypothetical protein